MVYRLINHAGCWCGTREEFVNHEPQASDVQILRVVYQHPECSTNIPSVLPTSRVFYQHPECSTNISLLTIETCGLLLLYNNSEDMKFFHGFTGTKNHS